MPNRRRERLGPHHAPAGQFTGRKGSDSKKRAKSSKKERRRKHGTHINKYAKKDV